MRFLVIGAAFAMLATCAADAAGPTLPRGSDLEGIAIVAHSAHAVGQMPYAKVSSRLPLIAKNTHYPRARSLMIEAGLEPQLISARPEHLTASCGYGEFDICKHYPEVIYCTADSKCEFLFARKTDKRLAIVTTFGDNDLTSCYCVQRIRWVDKDDLGLLQGIVIAKPVFRDGDPHP